MFLEGMMDSIIIIIIIIKAKVYSKLLLFLLFVIHINNVLNKQDIHLCSPVPQQT